jgi:hypothetical protein
MTMSLRAAESQTRVQARRTDECIALRHRHTDRKEDECYETRYGPGRDQALREILFGVLGQG